MKRSSGEDTDLGNTDPKLPVAMNDYPVEWFVEDVRDTRADVREQPDGVADEIRRPEDTVELAKDFLFVVVHDTCLQIGCSQTHVLDSEGVHLKWSVIDVANGHRYGIQEDGQRIPQVQPDNC